MLYRLNKPKTNQKKKDEQPTRRHMIDESTYNEK
jgi:hypothetical protein